MPGFLQAPFVSGGSSGAGADPGVNAGLYPVVPKSTSFTISFPADHDKVFVVDASSGPITVTLPVATPNGFRIHVKKIDPTANAVTVDADGTDTIDGSLTAVISGQNDSIPINSDGTNWVLL